MIIDDYCYFRGESQELNLSLPYYIILGHRGAGKSILCKWLSKRFKDIQFISFQTLDDIRCGFGRQRAFQIVHDKIGLHNIHDGFTRKDKREIKEDLRGYFL